MENSFINEHLLLQRSSSVQYSSMHVQLTILMPADHTTLHSHSVVHKLSCFDWKAANWISLIYFSFPHYMTYLPTTCHQSLHLFASMLSSVPLTMFTQISAVCLMILSIFIFSFKVILNLLTVHLSAFKLVYCKNLG